jgi:hypothetical protein
MARKTQEYRLSECRDKIAFCRRYRQNKDLSGTWNRMVDMYRGLQWGSTDRDDQDAVVVNMAYAICNVVQSSVTTQYPKFIVSPTTMGHDAQAVIAEAVLNYLWRHYDFQDQFRLAVKDFVIMGHGWLKVGWRYHEKTYTRQPSTDEMQGQLDQANAELTQVAASPVGLPEAGEMPTPTDLEEVQHTGPIQDIEVTDDDPFVERVSPFDVYVDPEATLPTNVRWIAQRIVRTLDEVHNDPMYDSRARNKVSADLSMTVDRDDTRRDDYQYDGDDTERVTVWEFYDIAQDSWCIFTESGEGFLRKPEPMPYSYGHPFVMFRNYEIPDEFYPMGEIEQIVPLQEEINKTRTQAVDARKNFIRKFIARTSFLNDRNRQAIQSDRDGEIILVDDDNAPLQEVLAPAPSLSFDPNIYNLHSNQVQQDLQTVTGLSDYQFGQMPDTRRLATEASIVEGATNARSSFKLAQIEKVLSVVGRHLLMVCQQYLEATKVARIAGPGGEMLFEFTAEDIEGEYDLAVEAGSTQPQNDQLRRQDAMALFNTLAPFMGTVIDPTEAIRYLLQQGFDLPNTERFFIQQAPPQPGMPGQPGLPGGTGPPAPGGPGGGPGMPAGAPEAPPQAPGGGMGNVVPIAG